VFIIPKKPKVAEATDNFDDSHTYECLKCGAEHINPVGKFYKSQWSESYLKNDRFVPLCKKCVDELFTGYEKKYGTETACILMCHKLDIPYYYSLYSSIVKNNNNFSMGLYLRQINGRQYQYQDFSQSILNGELGKTVLDHEKDKEVKWSQSDIQNRDYSIEVIGYDPFEGYPEEDRRFLFNQLFPYLEDDDIADDTYKLSQILQIVDNNKQIRQCDVKIANLDPIKDANDIKTLNSIKKDLVGSNDKIAKENEISVKNRSNKDIGKSTLTYLMRDLREKKFDKAEADYYDQLKGAGTLWAMEMSNKAILQNGMFDENDKKEVYEAQLKLIGDLNSELDDYKEQVRLLTVENDKLKAGVNDGET
jgi:hypothetical protein